MDRVQTSCRACGKRIKADTREEIIPLLVRHNRNCSAQRAAITWNLSPGAKVIVEGAPVIEGKP